MAGLETCLSTNPFKRFLCFLGFHSWGYFEFGHDEDNGKHHVECCHWCGIFRRMKK